jgi:hypothetical protein
MKMTKAKKGLIITLFAAMMVFAFGATSAFATEGDTVWDPTDAYASGTVENSDGVAVKYNAKRTWSDGLITAQMWTPAAAGATSEAIGTPKSFYDLNNAFVGLGTTQYDTWTYDQLATNFDAEDGIVAASQYDIVLAQPSYTEGYDAANIDKEQFTAGGNFNVTVYAQGFDPDSYAEQTVTLHTEIYGKQSEYAAFLYGAVPDQIITVTARTPAASQLKVTTDYKDLKYNGQAVENLLDCPYGTTVKRDVTATYDGKTHAIVTNEVPGFSVKYALRNEKTRVYEDVKAIEMKNAGEYKFTLQRWNDKTNKAVGDPVTVKVVIAPKDYLDFSFADLSYSATTAVPAGSEAKDFIESNAVEEDAVEAMTFFDKFYVLTTKVNKADSSIVTWSYDAIEGEDAQKAVKKEFETLLANYDNALVGPGEVTVKFVDGNTQFDDITFTYAPNATYKVKKAKKLKKTKSFTVEAVAKSGNAVTYQLTTPNKKISIDPATGKITVAKGLKKGTYKVTVKALTEAGNGYRPAKESVKLTIKIKK